MRHLISLSLFMALSLLSSKCYADGNDSDRNRHWMGRVEVASFNSLDWGVELGVDYRPIEYVGAGVSLCVADDFGDTYDSFTHNGMFYKNGGFAQCRVAAMRSPVAESCAVAQLRRFDAPLHKGRLRHHAACACQCECEIHGDAKCTGRVRDWRYVPCQKPWGEVVFLPFQNLAGARRESVANMARLHMEQHGRI